MKPLKLLSCLLFLAGLLLFPPNGSSCGPFFTNVVFVDKDRPGKPLQWYAEGHLGAVLPGFSRSYLVIAYRYLMGRPLSQGERDAALAYWRWSYERTYSDIKTPEDPAQQWLLARKQVLGPGAEAPQMSNYRLDDNGFGGSVTCLDDSFRTAVLTLGDRVRRYGADRAAIQEWIEGQDAVFYNCGQSHVVPPALPDGSPAWLKADRRYQIAAAHFYSRSFDQAAQDFDQIAGDAGSPWKSLAPYLAARALIRKGALSDPLSQDALRDADARLRKILNDPQQAALHDAARRSAGYIGLRIRREERNVELARALAGPGPDRDFQQDLIDYNWSLEHLADDLPDRGSAPGAPTAEDEKKTQGWAQERDRRWTAVQAENEMTDWILNFQDAGPASRDHALALWRKQRSLPWLLAALSKIDAKDKAAGELLKAAGEVAADSPAYPTVAYHRARLLIQAGDYDKARELLERFLGSPPARLTGSSRNLFLGQQMRLATSYHDFLVHAPRPVVDLDFQDGLFGYCEADACSDLLYGRSAKDKTELRFDGNAAAILNLRLPVELMAQAATGTELPEPLRGEMAAAAWTRAAMLDRHDVAATLVPEIEAAYPVLKEQMESYLAAKPEEKKYAALFVILHFPGMRPYVNTGAARETKIEKIDGFRDNWWCGDLGANVATNFEKDEMGDRSKPVIPKVAASYPAFLSSEEVRTAGTEWQALAKSGAGAVYLPGKTLAWARERPQDPRLAEALHYAVRSARYGCGEAGVSSLSKRAFKLLHERFPDSKWAKQTPYWY
jgi:hypothetical protein